MSTDLFMLTASFVSPDDTDTPHDVLASAEVNAVHEVYPDGDAAPAWIEPQAAGVLTKAALRVLLDALEVGIEGAYDDGLNPVADEVVAWVQSVRANVDLTS